MIKTNNMDTSQKHDIEPKILVTKETYYMTTFI